MDATTTVNTDDYIAIDRQTMLNFHGQYTFIFDGETLVLFETEQIKHSTNHPLTNQAFSENVLNYIKMHLECYENTQNVILKPDTLARFYSWYEQSRKSGLTPNELETHTDPYIAERYKIVKYYMTATDFESHFHNFNPEDTNEARYERALAEKALILSKPKTWLIRHSSLNRPGNEEDRKLLLAQGTRYYVLSYLSETYTIKHILLKQRVGMGWEYGLTDIWFPTFLECVEYTLTINGLFYTKRIGYYG